MPSSFQPALLVRETLAATLAAIVHVKVPQLLPCVLPLLRPHDTPTDIQAPPTWSSSPLETLCPNSAESVSKVLCATFQRIGQFITGNLNQNVLRQYLTSSTQGPRKPMLTINPKPLIVSMFGPLTVPEMPTGSVLRLFEAPNTLSAVLESMGSHYSPPIPSATSIATATTRWPTPVHSAASPIQKTAIYSFDKAKGFSAPRCILSVIWSQLRAAKPFTSQPFGPAGASPKAIKLRVYEIFPQLRLCLATFLAISVAIYVWAHHGKALPSWFKSRQTRETTVIPNSAALKPRAGCSTGPSDRALDSFSPTTVTRPAAPTFLQSQQVLTAAASIGEFTQRESQALIPFVSRRALWVLPCVPGPASFDAEVTALDSTDNAMLQNMVIFAILVQTTLWNAAQRGLTPVTANAALGYLHLNSCFPNVELRRQICELVWSRSGDVIMEDRLVELAAEPVQTPTCAMLPPDDLSFEKLSYQNATVDDLLVELESEQMPASSVYTSPQSDLIILKEENSGSTLPVELALKGLDFMGSVSTLDLCSCPELDYDDSASETATLTSTSNLKEDQQVAEIRNALDAKQAQLEILCDAVEESCGEYRTELKKPPHFRNQRINYVKRACDKLQAHISVLPQLKAAHESLHTYLDFMSEAQIEETPQILAARELQLKAAGLLCRLNTSQQLLENAKDVVQNPGTKGSVPYRNKLKLIAQNVYEYFTQVLEISRSQACVLPPAKEALAVVLYDASKCA